MLNERVRQNIQYLLAQKCWTQQTLIELAGIGRNSFYKIMRGESDLTLGMVERIAGGFGVPVDELLADRTAHLIELTCYRRQPTKSEVKFQKWCRSQAR